MKETTDEWMARVRRENSHVHLIMDVGDLSAEYADCGSHLLRVQVNLTWKEAEQIMIQIENQRP